MLSQCKSHGVCHLENPDKMYKIINVKDFQTCKYNMSVAEPRNQAEEVLSKCTSMRTATFPLIVPGRLKSSVQTTGQSTMCMAMTMTSTKRWGEWKRVWNKKYPHWHTLSKSSNSQSEQHYPAFTRDKLFFPRNRKEALDVNYSKHLVNFLSAAGNVSIETDSRNIHQNSWPITWTYSIGIVST